MSEPFCGHCNRIRLTADGKIRTCLFSVAEHDLRSLLRGGKSDDDLGDWLRAVVWQKGGAPSHRRAGVCLAAALDELHRRVNNQDGRAPVEAFGNEFSAPCPPTKLSSCSTWTTRCSTTTASPPTSSAISSAKSAPNARNTIGPSSSNCAPNSVTPTTSARCNATASSIRATRACSSSPNFLVNYPFANRLYPNSLDAIEHVKQWGPVVILSDGDVVFQPRKVERSGLLEAVDGNALIYVHKEKELDDVEQRYPAEHYVMVDDKLRILAAMKKSGATG